MLNTHQLLAIKNNIKPNVNLDFDIYSVIRFTNWSFFYEKKSILAFGLNKYGLEYLIFGLCVNLNEELDVITLIQNCSDEKEFFKLKYFFSGRYFIFLDDVFYTDCTGNLQIFYNSRCDVISTSLGLISQQIGLKPCELRYKEFKKLTFYPAPHTIYKGIFVLLSWEQIRKSKITQTKRKIIDYSDYQSIQKNIISSTGLLIKKISDNYQVVLPLTGGIDSRTILAFLLKLKINFSAYTTFYKKIKFYDIFTPIILAIINSFSYRLIVGKVKYNFSELKLRLLNFRSHTGYNCLDKDIVFYTFDLYPKPTPKRTSVMLRGAGWAVFRGFYINDISELKFKKERLAELRRLFPNIEECAIAESVMESWLDNEQHFTYDWRIQFYVDHRLNAWDGSIEQSIHLNGFFPMLIMNSEYQFDLLLSKFNFDFRELNIRSKIIQKKIISDLYPTLNLLPYNFYFMKYCRSIIKKMKRLF